jgi:hypothetical protein
VLDEIKLFWYVEEEVTESGHVGCQLGALLQIVALQQIADPLRMTLVVAVAVRAVVS